MTHEANHVQDNAAQTAQTDPQSSKITYAEYLALTDSEPKHTYINVVLGGLDFVRVVAEKTETFFPDPPIPEDTNAQMAQLDQEHINAIEEAMGRPANRNVYSGGFYEDGDSIKIILRHGLEYDFLDSKSGVSIRYRDIEEGQKIELANARNELGEVLNALKELKASQDQGNGSDTPHSDALPPEESL